MRTMSEKMQGKPAETGGVLDNERVAEKLDLQSMRYRAGNADPALVEKARKLVKKAEPGDINIGTMILAHEIALPYLHNAAVQRGYKAVPDPPGTHNTGLNRDHIYSIPRVDLELARTELRRFGLIKEV